MALGGWLGTLADPGGLRVTRARALGSFAVLGALVVPLAEWSARSSWAATLLVAIVAFVCTLVRALGPAAATIGTMIAIVAAVGTGKAGTSTYALDALAFAAGAAWATLLTSIVWPVSTHRPVRAAVAAVYDAMSEYAEEIATTAQTDEAGPAWTAIALRHQRLIQNEIQDALAIALAVRSSRPGESAVGADLRVLLGRAEALFAELIALSVELEQVPVGARPARIVEQLRVIAKTHATIARSLVTPRSASPLRNEEVAREDELTDAGSPIDVLANQLARGTSRARALAAVLGSGVAVVGESAALAPRTSYDALATAIRDEARELRDALSPRSVFFRHALRVAFAVTVASIVGHRIAAQPHWVTITTLAVLQPYPGPTSKRAAERVVGTVLGSAVAAVITITIRAPLALAFIMFPLSVAAVATRGRSYRLFTFFLTPVFVLIAERHPGDWWTAAARAADAVAGGVIALVAALVAFPSWERTRLPDAIDRMVPAVYTYRDVVIANVGRGGEDLADVERRVADARRAAGIAIGEAETSLERWMAEPLRRLAEGEKAMQAVTHARRLASACTTLHSHTVHGVSDAASRDRHMRAIAAYGEALRGSGSG